MTEEEWATAEALAVAYVRAERAAVDPISFRRYEYAPGLVAVWWPGGEAYVLVYDGTIHHERGSEAVAAYCRFLGPERLRRLAPTQLDRLLGILDAPGPDPAQFTNCWREQFQHYEDLHPAVVESAGVIKYVLHYIGGAFRPLPPAGAPRMGGPPPGGRPPGGSAPVGGGAIIGGPLRFQRWSIQLYPPVPDVSWQLEESFERAPLP